MSLPADVIARDKQVQTSIADIASSTSMALLPDLSTLSQGEAGGSIRKVAESVSLEVGKAASVAATKSYADISEAGRTVIASKFAADVTANVAAAHKYDGLNLAEIDVMLARDPSNAALRTARAWAWNNARNFTPTTVDVTSVVAKNLEGVVGHSMARYMSGVYADAEVALSSGVSRMVENIYRDTMASNSEQDAFARGYQRVASPDACSFCLMVALNEYTSFEESGGYHDHCSCTAVPIFSGMTSYSPDYYDGFRDDYYAARDSVDSSSAEDILAAIRVVTGRA